MALDTALIVEFGVEIGYGAIYLILAFTTIMKYRATKNRLALWFFAAFLALAISGLYGGFAGILSASGYSILPIIGNKILEIYVGLALIALVFFIIGLIKI